jgi:CheY-like chemotaxis protein
MATDPPPFDPGILFVEDDPLTREQMADLLRQRFNRLQVAGNGEEGLSLYRQMKPDIVITDILMPVMNGSEMTRRIRELDPDARIIVITAFSEKDLFREEGQRPVQYVFKPVDMDDLFRAIDCCKD